MRVSIWKQFSSNHSANFTVVGEFADSQAAENAAHELRGILARIEAWWDALPLDEHRKWRSTTETSILTPIERELQKQYNVEWVYSLNWYHWIWDRVEDAPVSILDRYVFVDSPHWCIWCGPQPFDSLVRVLGGIPYIRADESRTFPDTALLINVICTLPEESLTAERLYQRFREDFLAHRTNLYEAYKHYPPTIPFAFNYDHLNKRFVSDDIRIYEAERTETELKLYGIAPFEVDRPSKTLPHFIDYLRSEGCTDLRYEFLSVQIVGRKDEEAEE